MFPWIILTIFVCWFSLTACLYHTPLQYYHVDILHRCCNPVMCHHQYGRCRFVCQEAVLLLFGNDVVSMLIPVDKNRDKTVLSSLSSSSSVSKLLFCFLGCISQCLSCLTRQSPHVLCWIVADEHIAAIQMVILLFNEVSYKT